MVKKSVIVTRTSGHLVILLLITLTLSLIQLLLVLLHYFPQFILKQNSDFFVLLEKEQKVKFVKITSIKLHSPTKHWVVMTKQLQQRKFYISQNRILHIHKTEKFMKHKKISTSSCFTKNGITQLFQWLHIIWQNLQGISQPVRLEVFGV